MRKQQRCREQLGTRADAITQPVAGCMALVPTKASPVSLLWWRGLLSRPERPEGSSSSADDPPRANPVVRFTAGAGLAFAPAEPVCYIFTAWT